ncbi:hypothetical protein NEAUS04_2342 [Nematocida ausubeli]|uniref:Mechanosensitive ion channel MscS domain-containing protein n=1 Tax=Nematocida ausubeli (strain ATCC PRA-371 / ERTm2) TaxID=1913371 RepID=H8ZFQ4_NEMA1|nr:uncharacterized protein NESG_00473 [Nematocida ausubeli]EHY64615.1 hypothetical protein NERG_02425 [Nematocida ausubeli]KAI5137377.1 hypothetical protein NEAUS06_2206 [Nematocida ausubeli]KAI5138578.1 hypothetical protein NEAUS07_2367 [Nematocida ausubeli]KAI5151120.1 hypothetical protein NEAUS05_2410 [Nematocida ausubeli]KAI5164622.1 hypothetical protein NEAUS04_2342 [Nematocida ausubeli]
MPILSAVAGISLLDGRSGILNSYKPVLLDMAKSSSVLFNLPVSVGDSVSINNSTGKITRMTMQYITLENKEATTYIPTHLVYGYIIKKFK